MSNIVGIDLGTTFSGLAVLNSIGRPEIIPNADGERITPSALFFTEDEGGKVLVGRDALNSLQEDAARSVRWIKRHMGEPAYPQEILGRMWTPSELSCFILRKLREDCSKQIGPISDVVITVPAYFDEVRRKATMDAGKMAGLNVVGIVNEPTAAALYYAITHRVSGRIMVFDLGGGTFDVTIMDVTARDIDIVCSNGDHQLGGYDFDQKIVERFAHAYESAKGCSLYATPEDRARYEGEAEDAKKIVSKRPKAKKLLTGKAGSLPYELAREDFEEDISAYIARIEMLIEDVLDEAGNAPSSIDKVLLVGGSSRIPLVQARLTKMFGFAPTTEVNLDECVALGAALHAGLRLMDVEPSKVSTSVAAGLRDVRLTDVCNHSYGTICVTVDEETRRPLLTNDILIKKNTPLPCEIAKTYHTISNDQRAIEATVTQGEGEDPEFVNKIAVWNMDLPPNRPAGRPIKVTYSYDTNERMRCVFLDEESGLKTERDIDIQDGKAKRSAAQSKAVLDDFTVE